MSNPDITLAADAMDGDSCVAWRAEALHDRFAEHTALDLDLGAIRTRLASLMLRSGACVDDAEYELTTRLVHEHDLDAVAEYGEDPDDDRMHPVIEGAPERTDRYVVDILGLDPAAVVEEATADDAVGGFDSA